MLIAPVAARAQDLPSYAHPAPAPTPAQDQPSYAHPVPVDHEQRIHGRIASIDGTFHIRVRDDRGYIDSVELHQGTIINPTGLTLATGMSVTVSGYPTGSVFRANEIDTPYNYAGPVPVPVYYGPGWWYPGYGYGYGPSYSLSLVFGEGGWGYARRPFSGYGGYGRGWYGHSSGYAHAYGGARYGLGTGHIGGPGPARITGAAASLGGGHGHN
jgi:hypothetical protein